MTQDMVLNKKYSKIYALLLLLLMAAGNAMAQGGVVVGGNVYGGGNLADVKVNTEVKMAGGTVAGNVFGGGKGKADTYECEKAMVGVNNAGAEQDPSTNENKNKGTQVTISNGTVGTLVGEEGSQTLKEGTGNVYGGGEIGRVEWNTQVTIGDAAGSGTPVIHGNVFGAGAGKETHGYSALVRGNSTVIIQGKAKVGKNVYGGGEKATAGRYWISNIVEDPTEAAPTGMPDGMPYKTRGGGKCYVTVKGNAQIGPDGNATETEGHVFGAGKGVTPAYYYDLADTEHKEDWSKRMMNYTPYDSETEKGYKPEDENIKWSYYPGDSRFVWEYFTTEAKYLEFLQTMALATETHVTVNGDASHTSVKGSVYGGSESGFVQDDTEVTIESGVIGTSGSYGNVFGGGKGLPAFAEAGKVKGNTNVAISGGTAYGNVYGGGELGDVGTINKADINNYIWTGNSPAVPADPDTDTPASAAVIVSGLCNVSIAGSSAEVMGNVFGAGKGEPEPSTFWCEKAIVYTTNVSIENGTVNGNVYGGGEVGRVEYDTQMKIGVKPDGSTETTFSPDIKGNVFGAGAGVETHGYSALVRGDCYVTIDNDAKVEHNVYGGGEIATAGRYKIATKANIATVRETYPEIEIGMPYETNSGGKCTVIVRGGQIGPDADNDVSNSAGHVFGAGKGVGSDIFDEKYTYAVGNRPYRMTLYDADDFNEDGTTVYGTTWASYTADPRFVLEYYERNDYLKFLQTLALVTKTDVTISGNATVKGSVYGGSESGFVQDDTHVTIGIDAAKKIGTENKDFGHVFGGGRGLPTFAEAGKVKGNTNVSISSGTMLGSVYGGGELGDVGTINKANIRNYAWVANTGKCEVEITGAGAVVSGNVFGAGKGEAVPTTFWCEKAMVNNAEVSISNGTVNHNVYGGGEKGRVENNTEVTIGPESGSCTLDIKGSVFGAGMGVVTHGYSALVRGNTTVTVQSNAVVEKSVYGGGEIASVGRYGLDAKGMPSQLLGGGDCVVTVLGAVQIGTNGGGNVFGAGKGETPAWVYGSGDKSDWSKRMMTYNSSYKVAGKGTKWDYSDATEQYVWEYFPSSTQYSKYLETLALATNPTVTINGTIDGTGTTNTVNGSVYGGGEVGITKGAVVVNINGGSIAKDVYGGGALADTNTGNWSPNKNYVQATTLTEGETYFTKEDVYTEITDVAAVAKEGITYYTKNGNTYEVATVTTGEPVTGKYTKSIIYTAISYEDAIAASGTYYETEGGWTDASGTAWKKTTVNLLGGLIKGDAYGGGLGQKDGFNGKTEDIPAVVWGDISITLNGTKFDINYDTTTDPERDNEGNIVTDGDNTVYVKVVKSGRVFGCNNLLGSPQGDVTVTVWKTVAGNTERTSSQVRTSNKAIMDNHPGDYESVNEYVTPTYEVAAVYGGGNLAPYEATGKKAHVIIYGCDDTSIQTVYGGGNAASVPETDVDIHSCYEIGSVFGGGNGKDKYKNDAGWQINPGANVGTEIQPGNANTMIYGGTVHKAYGGSNEKGTIYGDVTIDVVDNGLKQGDYGYCKLDVGQLVGAGKNADVNGNLKIIMGCKPNVTIPLVFGGADNANVNGDVELTVTSGKFGNIVGGNNNGGRIKGHIILNIEETTCIPLNIDHLYLCGYNAAYSQYGYYVKTKSDNPNATLIGAPSETPDLNPTNGKLQLIPRESANDSHLPIDTYSYTYNAETGEAGATWTVLPITGDNKFEGYAPPVLNVTSCTSIGEVFGGGYGTTATVYGNPTVNINMIPGAHADEIDRDGDKVADGNDNALGAIGDVYGGGDAAAVYGNTTVNIGTETTVQLHESISREGVYTMSKPQDVKGAYITGNVYGGGDNAIITGDTEVNICTADYSSTANFVGFSINNSVYGGGCNADVRGNTNVTMSGGYVFNGIFGGGYAGSVGTFNRSPEAAVGVYGHTAHEGCIGKPISCAENTGKCTVVVNGGQIGPIEVATEGMNRPDNEGGPVPQGWVWGGGCGIVEDPSADPDTHFKTYVNNTDVTIKGNAFILESIIGGGEFGRVLGNTLVKIEGGQIGVGENKVTDGKPVAYTEAQWTEAEEAVKAGSASRINAIAEQMPACSHLPYGRNDGTNWVYDTYDPYADEWKTAHSSDKYPGGSTDNASDGKTWIGCVFAGGSGYMPFVNRNSSDEITDYNWVPSAGWVEGNAEVRITGGHILTNVYGGNEYTDVKGKCTVKMSGGSVGVPLSLSNKRNNPMTGNIYGAGKGDPRVNFNKVTNVKDVEVEITGGIVYGSVYGGGEDGHVLRDVTITIGKQTTTEGVTTSSGPTIGTWGTTYVDGNIFGGGRGFSGEAYTAGNVAGSVKLEIKGGQILGSVYGGGRMASVGYGLFDAITNGQTTPGYGEMRADSDTETGFNSEGFFTKGRGHIDITISGGTIGNSYEYIYNPSDALKSSTMPLTEFDSDNRLKHTKGGNVFAGGMGNLYEQNGTTFIHIVDWWRLGCVKSTKLTITGGTIKSCIYGGGELGQVVGYHTTKNAADQDINVGTEVIINGGTIGTEVTENDVTQYTFGSVFGSGYGSLVEVVGGSYPKYIAGRVKAGTKVNMTAGSVLASVYGGGEMAAVGESKTLDETLTTGHSGDTYVSVSGGTVGIAPITISGSNRRYFGGAKMGNVYGGGSGHGNTVRSGHVYGNTNVTISAGSVSGEPRIYHNIYGGGAYGSVGDFTYQTDTDAQTGTQKVFGVEGLNTAHTNSGVARVTITGGTIGYDGKENGMVFGSSRGDINAPGARDDHAAWVYDTHVTIGTSAKGTPGQQDYVAESGPQINGTVYGSGENGHVFNNTVVTINGGTIGIASGFPITTNDNGTPDDPSDDTKLSGAEYPYRGNVYGGGCGTDMYYSDPALETHDGNGQLYNSLAGIVYGNATINITGGRVVRNVYGAGAMGSVTGRAVTTTANNVTTTTYIGGTTTINISGGIVGVDGNNGDGNVFGAARGNATTTQTDVALVKNTSVNISANAKIKGNVYGGGETGDVLGNTEVNVCAVKQTSGEDVTYVVTSGNPTIGGNVYGGGEGAANSFTCWKAMVGVEGDGVTGSGTTESPYDLQDGGTTVRIYNGKVTGNVYGGGKIARVERNTSVEIGAATGATAPLIYGNVFAAGAGLETHGYSALVRGTSTVTVQGSAQVWKNVFGGGEKASVGRYKVKTPANSGDKDVPATLPLGMPARLLAGGTSTVNIQGSAEIGIDSDANTGHVYGAGQGVGPSWTYTEYTSNDTPYSTRIKNSKRMVNYTSSTAHPVGKQYKEWDYYIDENGREDQNYVWEYFPTESAYLQFIESLAISAATDVTIGGGTVKGSVFGGSESGFVYHNTDVKIQGGTVNGDAFGGGRGLPSFAEAGRVGWNTNLAVSGGTVKGNVYGGGNLGDVGTINKSDQTNHNYVWKNTDSNGNNMDPDNNNTAENNSITGTNKNTGICTVTISGGMIGVDNPADATKQGNVFGASHGSDKTYWCEKATVFATNVTITDGIVKGNVYGGGEIGRVEDDTKVTIGTGLTGDESGNDNHPTITGNVFGAGAGEETHGYSALVRGNCITTVQGTAKVGKNVYGGGEKATAGKYWISKFVPEPGNPAPEGMPDGMPYKTRGGGKCYVTVKDNAQIGPNGGATEFDGHLFGAGKGVTPAYCYDPANTGTKENWSKRMMTYNASTHVSGEGGGEGTTWDYYPEDSRFVWEYFTTEAKYLEFLQTLALATETHVTVQGNATVMGTVYGGSDSGFVQDDTEVNILGQSKIGTKEAHSYSNIFGGGKGHETFHEAGMVKGNTTVNAFGGEIYGSVYGGGAMSKVVGSTNVNIGEPAE